MGQDLKTSGVAIEWWDQPVERGEPRPVRPGRGPGPRPGKWWRIKRAKRRRPHSDPTVAMAAARDNYIPKDEVRAHMVVFADAARANRRLGIGLLAAKMMDSKRPPRDLTGKVRDVFGVEMTGRELRAAASEARTAIQDSIVRRFDSSPRWSLQWLPEICGDEPIEAAAE